MRFEWDEAKRQLNIRRHGIDFADAVEVFQVETVTVIDDRYEYGEMRFLTLGLVNGIVVAVSQKPAISSESFPQERRRKMRKSDTSTKSETDWKRLRSMKDEDIDFSDIPPMTPEMFAKAVIRRGLKPIPRKKQLTLRMDSDVIEWFKKQGRGYQTKINSLLRAYMEEHRRRAT
jgi:uncharacterized protein (DUF4415 family)